jgi:hypothetical protein
MMLKTLAAAAAILFAGHAAAQCKDMEYAQIKDMLATPEGKKKVYLERCFADVMTAHLYTLGGPGECHEGDSVRVDADQDRHGADRGWRHRWAGVREVRLRTGQKVTPAR